MSFNLNQPTLQFIHSHWNEDPGKLALQAGRYPEVNMTEALNQIAGRQAAIAKLPSWHAIENIFYPNHLSMEQCSSELTARYKASLVSGNRLVDITGGFGIDCSFLAQRFQKADYVERQELLCELAEHNFPLLGLNHIRIHHADGVDYLKAMEPADCIFLDPARRDRNGGKTILVSDCEPDAGLLEPVLLAKASQVLIKLSPMLDISMALKALPHTAAVHIVSLNNECKETLLLLKREVPDNIPVYCVNLSSGKESSFCFTREEEAGAVCICTAELGHFLYEPNTSLLKAGAYRILAERYGLKKLHPNSHLYTSDEAVNDFPGRIFSIKSTCSLNKKELKATLGDLKKANLTIRNFPESVAGLRKRIRLSEGGDTYLFATTLADETKKLIICKKHSV